MASKLAGPKYIELSKGETTIFADLMVLKYYSCCCIQSMIQLLSLNS